MCDYYEFFNSITSASNNSDFDSAIRNYLNNSVMQWWRGLQENERQAIILLDFDPSIVTTMTFFGQNCSFSSCYWDVLQAILNKVDLLANEEKLNNWIDLIPIIDGARAQKLAEKRAREKAAAIAKEMELTTGFNALETLLVKNSGAICNSKKYKMENAKEMRKAFLKIALNYLRENYNKKEDE